MVGKDGYVRIEIKNTLNDDAEDVSLSLQLANTPFITIGSSEESVDEILSDDEESFAFRIRASSSAKPGDYVLPYTLSYVGDNGSRQTKQGTLGVTIAGESDLTFTVSTDTPVVGEKGKVTLKVINNGLADAKFVSVKLLPQGYTLLSDSDIYIGTVSSDDFETVTADVIFSNDRPKLSALISYKNFDNEDVSTTVTLPITVYTREKAIELGIVKKSYGTYYVGIVVVILVLWFIWRTIRKRRRMKASLNGS
jgi:uncharacterized repeat protein (TIGR01451 family)